MEKFAVDLDKVLDDFELDEGEGMKEEEKEKNLGCIDSYQSDVYTYYRNIARTTVET